MGCITETRSTLNQSRRSREGLKAIGNNTVSRNYWQFAYCLYSFIVVIHPSPIQFYDDLSFAIEFCCTDQAPSQVFRDIYPKLGAR